MRPFPSNKQAREIAQGIAANVIEMNKRLGFRYPPSAAARAASRVTADMHEAQIKGILDYELTRMERKPAPAGFVARLAPWHMEAY